MANPSGLDVINEACDYLGLSDIVTAQMDNDGIAKHALTAFNMTRREIYQVNPDWGYLRSKYSLAVTAGTTQYNLTSLQSDLDFENILLEEVTVTDLENNVSKIEHTEKENYLNYLLPNSIATCHFYKDVDSSGVELFTLTVSPTEACTITIPYKKKLTSDLTSSNITSELEFPIEDQNMLSYGTAWWLAKRLKMDREIIDRAERDYIRARTLSSLTSFLIQHGNRERISPLMRKFMTYGR